MGVLGEMLFVLCLFIPIKACSRCLCKSSFLSFKCGLNKVPANLFRAHPTLSCPHQ